VHSLPSLFWMSHELLPEDFVSLPDVVYISAVSREKI
jgi:hypothetical protein